MTHRSVLSRLFGAVLTVSLVTIANASPISLSASLTGDPRLAAAWQDLKIDVTITSDTTSNIANWLVNINSPSHPSAKLDEFYFNMVGSASSYSISNFNPTTWTLETPPTTQGGGNITPIFLFSVQDGANGNAKIDVTNTRDLSFSMTKVSGLFSIDDFLNAAISDSTDALLADGQLGAHLQGLQQGQSGFLFGRYVNDTQPPCTANCGGGSTEIPEPASLALVGLGLLGMAVARRRKL